MRKQSHPDRPVGVTRRQQPEPSWHPSKIVCVCSLLHCSDYLFTFYSLLHPSCCFSGRKSNIFPIPTVSIKTVHPLRIDFCVKALEYCIITGPIFSLIVMLHNFILSGTIYLECSHNKDSDSYMDRCWTMAHFLYGTCVHLASTTTELKILFLQSQRSGPF